MAQTIIMGTAFVFMVLFCCVAADNCVEIDRRSVWGCELVKSSLQCLGRSVLKILCNCEWLTFRQQIFREACFLGTSQVLVFASSNACYSNCLDLAPMIYAKHKLGFMKKGALKIFSLSKHLKDF